MLAKLGTECLASLGNLSACTSWAWVDFGIILFSARWNTLKHTETHWNTLKYSTLKYIEIYWNTMCYTLMCLAGFAAIFGAMLGSAELNLWLILRRIVIVRRMKEAVSKERGVPRHAWPGKNITRDREFWTESMKLNHKVTNPVLCDGI